MTTAPPPPLDGLDPGEDEPSAPYRLHELARLSGVPERTIRFYQAEGLLPSPRREGRDARYEDRHREQLELIGELQDRGFSLKSIRHLLERMPADRSVAEWLGIHDLLSQPWSDERPRLLSGRDLDALLADRPPGVLGALERGGFLVRQPAADTWLAPIPSLLDLALRLQDAGVDIGLSGEALGVLRRSLVKAADDVARLLLGRSGDGTFQGMGPAELAGALAVMRPFTRQAAASLFAEELERVLRQHLTERQR